MFRAAVIGCGWIGGGAIAGDAQPYTHAGSYRAVDGVTLVAGCDPDEIRLRRFGENWGARHLYHDLTGFLAGERVDLVSVCTPDATHEGIVRQVIEAEAARAIICEKPLTCSSTAARDLIELCGSRGVSLYVNYQRRWDPAHQAVRQWLEAGHGGVIRAVQGYYVRGLCHNGVAWINLLRMLAGEVVSVRALPGEIRELPGDPTLSAWLELDNGAAATMRGMSRTDYSLFEMDIVGSAGRVILADSGREIRFYQTQGDRDYPGFRRLGTAEDGLQASLGALQDVIREAVTALDREQPSLSSAREAAHDLDIVERIRESAEQQGAIVPVSAAGCGEQVA